jgi:mRNA interferase MazF
MPPFGDWLVSGVSTQLYQFVNDFDELIDVSDPDFPTSGLKAASIVRLGFVATLPPQRFLGVIGSIAQDRNKRVLRRLAEFLRPK